MTMRQIDRLKVVQALADGHLKTGIAASRLGLTPIVTRVSQPTTGHHQALQRGCSG